jgi:hypothetical protein
MGMGGQRHAPAALPRYSLYRRMGGPQGLSERVPKISPPPGFDSRIFWPLASRYIYRGTAFGGYATKFNLVKWQKILTYT